MNIKWWSLELKEFLLLAVFLLIRRPLILDDRPKDASGHFDKQQVVKKRRRQQTASEFHKIERQKENFVDN